MSVTFCLSPRGDKHFYIHGGQTFSSGGGSGNDDFDCDEEEDVSKANILARILTVPEGSEILVNDNCHFMALYALCYYSRHWYGIIQRLARPGLWSRDQDH